MDRIAVPFLARCEDFLHRILAACCSLTQDKLTENIQVNDNQSATYQNSVVIQVLRDYDFLPCSKCGGVAVWEGFNDYELDGLDVRDFCFGRIVFESFYVCRCGWRSDLRLRWFKLPEVKHGKLDSLLG
jgi:hypothetical protein